MAVTAEQVDSALVRRWLTAATEAVVAERELLTQLDAAIGDGDHGVNMSRGMSAVRDVLASSGASSGASAAAGSPGADLVLAGRTLISKVGGASGPLYGAAMRGAGRALAEHGSTGPAELAAALRAGLEAICRLGGAQPGDKTMVDAWSPAVAALDEALAAGRPFAAAAAAAASAAEEGMRATVPLRARKGRASYLGERSEGHQDPGATSTAMLFRALADIVDQPTR
ncbi:MAG: dihydroxyacetone kinase subunit DhaL [Frankiaceae bacterium]